MPEYISEVFFVRPVITWYLLTQGANPPLGLESFKDPVFEFRPNLTAIIPGGVYPTPTAQFLPPSDAAGCFLVKQGFAGGGCPSRDTAVIWKCRVYCIIAYFFWNSSYGTKLYRWVWEFELVGRGRFIKLTYQTTSLPWWGTIQAYTCTSCMPYPTL